MNTYFSETGIFSEYITGYEYRKEQQKMAEFIEEQLFEKSHAFIEAGTGTGKTIAYLLPSILYALENEKRITITTETKALQKQLIDKDLPLLHNIFKYKLGKDFSYSLCLGGANYPCRQRFELLLKFGKLKESDFKHIDRVAAKFKEKTVFTRLDFPLPQQIWSEIHREGEICNPFKCPFASNCPFQMAKKEWMQSNILVMNHYLFFTNIAFDKIYLPDTEVVVFDEAHSVEDIAASQLGFNLRYDELIKILDSFEKKGQKGLIYVIKDEEARDECIEILHVIRKEAKKLFNVINNTILKQKQQVRLTQPLHQSITLVDAIKKIVLLLSKHEDQYADNELLMLEFDIARGKLFLFNEHLAIVAYMSKENYVYWAEADKRSVVQQVSIKAQPIEISEIMEKEVINHYESVFFVSATLAINNNFSYFAYRFGVQFYNELICDHVFNYKEQVVLYLDRNRSDPNSEFFYKSSSDTVKKIIRLLQGKCLMLFTSYKMLEEVKQHIEPELEYEIYSQSDHSAMKAFNDYKKDESGVLMGTHSFWQGIDLPGDLLRGVIIMKLPFAVPDSPPLQAKIERITASGRNAFSHFQIPSAVIKLRQGFGRLIRRKDDRGIVAILDPRIINKSYGKIFYNSLPKCRTVYSINDLTEIFSGKASKTSASEDDL